MRACMLRQKADWIHTLKKKNDKKKPRMMDVHRKPEFFSAGNIPDRKRLLLPVVEQFNRFWAVHLFMVYYAIISQRKQRRALETQHGTRSTSVAK